MKRDENLKSGTLDRSPWVSVDYKVYISNHGNERRGEVVKRKERIGTTDVTIVQDNH